MIFDAHLDLAENVTLFGRDLTLPAHARRNHERARATPGPEGQATVGLPDMRYGGIAVACATVTPGFLAADVGADFEPRRALYTTPQQAEAQALRQLDLYVEWARRGLIRLLRSAADLQDHLTLWQDDRTPGLILLMESADPIVQVADLSHWFERGLRMIGLTYGDTAYAAGVQSGKPLGTRSPGGLTDAGVALLERMGELGMIWDISHLADAGVYQGLDIGYKKVCASHATARSLTPTDRHLSDDVLQSIARCGGVIGLPLYNAFLEPRWRQDKSIPVTLAEHARRHLHTLAAVAGWAHVGIGSDLDGGFGLEQSPAEIDTIADLGRLGDILPPEQRRAVLAGNWLRFFAAALPGGQGDFL